MLTLVITFVGGVEKTYYHVPKDSIKHDECGGMSFIHETVGIEKRLGRKEDVRKAFVVKDNVCVIDTYPEED